MCARACVYVYIFRVRAHTYTVIIKCHVQIHEGPFFVSSARGFKKSVVPSFNDITIGSRVTSVNREVSHKIVIVVYKKGGKLTPCRALSVTRRTIRQ